MAKKTDPFRDRHDDQKGCVAWSEPFPLDSTVMGLGVRVEPGRHDASKGDQGLKRQSRGSSLCVELEADIIDTGLFVHLAQQLHQVLTVDSRQLTIDLLKAYFCVGSYRCALRTSNMAASFGLMIRSLRRLDGALPEQQYPLPCC